MIIMQLDQKRDLESLKVLLIKNGGRLGAGAVVLPGKVVGEEGFAAAGSLVTKDIPARKVVIGSPAKVLKDVPEDQLLENQ